MGSECLSEGCYTFEITDSYGDGICCSYGQGSFSVKLDGAEILSGGSFGSSASESFCANNSSPTQTPAPTKSPSKPPTKSPTKSPTESPTELSLDDPDWEK